MLTEDAQRDAAVQARFEAVALHGPEHRFAYPTGEVGLAALGYAPQHTALLPAGVRQRFCGVGNVLMHAALAPGQRVLDVGCGCGVDTLLATITVGSGGAVWGLDMNRDMLHVARQGATQSGIANAIFLRGDVCRLPWPDATFDAVISNGVFSLLPHKRRALRELMRVLRTGGRLVVADQVRLPFAPSLPVSTALTDAPAHSAAGWAL